MSNPPPMNPPPLQKPPGYRDASAVPVTVQKPPSAAAYKPRHPTAYKPKKRKLNCCKLFCCKLFCCILCFMTLFLFIVVAVAAALFYLIYTPKLPIFHLLAFRISLFTISSTPSGSFLTARAAMRVQIENPNDKLSIRYGKIEYDVTVGEATEFGRREITGFTQEWRESTIVKTEAIVKKKTIGVEDGKRLLARYKSKAMDVKVVMETAVGVGARGWQFGPVTIKFDCQSKLKSFEAGKMPNCNTNLLGWINIPG